VTEYITAEKTTTENMMASTRERVGLLSSASAGGTMVCVAKANMKVLKELKNSVVGGIASRIGLHGAIGGSALASPGHGMARPPTPRLACTPRRQTTTTT